MVRKSASLVLMNWSIPWEASERSWPVLVQVFRNSSSCSAFLESFARPAAASLIELRVSPAFSKAMVAAASALDGSAATSPSIIGASSAVSPV